MSYIKNNQNSKEEVIDIFKEDKKEEKEEKLLKSLFPYAIMQTRIMEWREYPMTHIKTLNGATLKQSASYGGCGECQTSCHVCLQDLLHGRQPEV